jgi:hypothetical protein
MCAASAPFPRRFTCDYCSRVLPLDFFFGRYLGGHCGVFSPVPHPPTPAPFKRFSSSSHRRRHSRLLARPSQPAKPARSRAPWDGVATKALSFRPLSTLSCLNTTAALLPCSARYVPLLSSWTRNGECYLGKENPQSVCLSLKSSPLRPIFPPRPRTAPQTSA